METTYPSTVSPQISPDVLARVAEAELAYQPVAHLRQRLTAAERELQQLMSARDALSNEVRRAESALTSQHPLAAALFEVSAPQERPRHKVPTPAESTTEAAARFLRTRPQTSGGWVIVELGPGWDWKLQTLRNAINTLQQQGRCEYMPGCGGVKGRVRMLG